MFSFTITLKRVGKEVRRVVGPFRNWDEANGWHSCWLSTISKETWTLFYKVETSGITTANSKFDESGISRGLVHGMMDELGKLLSPKEKLELEKKVESYSNWKAEKRRKTLEENIHWDGDAGAYADGCYDWHDDLEEVGKLLNTHE